MGKGTKARGGLSKKEWEKAHGKKWDGGSSRNYQDIVDEILGNFDDFRDPITPFEDIYDDKMKAEDTAQSEAMFKPFYEQQIADTMEDLQAWEQMEAVDYNRTLRQGRAKMARGGGAIGSERTQWEGEVKTDSDFRKAGKQRETERAVGSDRMTEAGYNPTYDDRKGGLIDDMDAAIEEQTLWYRDQRSQRHYADAGRTYRG